MPLARILSRNFREALKFSEQLRLCCSEIEIEIASPDENHPHSADLEILIENHDPRTVLSALVALADKQQASVFVAPGTLITQAENSTNGANSTAEELKAIAQTGSVANLEPALETAVSRRAKAFDTIQQLWWRYRLLMEIQAAQRERFGADAKRLKKEERRKAQAAKAARRQAVHLEETKQAILEAFLHSDPSTAAATGRAETWQEPEDGPGLGTSPSLVPESREVRKRARGALARFAVAVIILCAAGAFSFVKRRPASPLSNEAVQRSESIEEQVPFGAATAPSPQVVAMVPQRVETGRVRTNTSVEHLQNGEEVRYLGDDVTVRYFPPKRKKNELTRSSPRNASVTRAKSNTSTIAHNGTAAIKEISDLD